MNSDAEPLLAPYVARLALDWLETAPDRSVRVFDGTLAFVDIAGFTRLTEILAGSGKAGAEEMTGYLDSTFRDLLEIAYASGGELIKWGGDAVLLWYTGESHAPRAVEAAWRMQRTMRRIGRLRTSAGRAILRMSVGINSGEFHFFSVGSHHRELIVTGASASHTAHLEAVAEAGEIVVSAATAALLSPDVVGAGKSDGLLICGAPKVTASPTPTGVPNGRPSLCLPSALGEFLVAAPIESEHRQISVAFVEFSGADKLLAVAGADALADALQDFFATVQDACVRHRVTFWETDIAENGGKVMLVAGAPSATDDDAGAILVTVRDIVSTGDRLRMRGGVNCGRVFTGGFGPYYRRTYSAKGDAINLAARLMGRAGGGEVFATDAVLERSRVGFVSEKLEPFLVKGKVQTVHAQRVVATKSGRKPISQGGMVLVGREKELGFIADLIDSAVSGCGACVEVSGPPGIGKSRLIEETETRAAACRTVAVVCDEYGHVSPYASLRVLLRQILAVEMEESAVVTGVRLEAAVKRLAPDLVPWIPLLAPVVGAEVEPTTESSALDVRFRNERLADALVQLLVAALEGPILFVVEDAQWMDDASASLVRHLASVVAGYPWLVLIARRPSARGLRIGDLPYVDSIQLEPLSNDAVLQLLRSVTAERPLAPHQRDTLAERSGGNPLFLLELIEAGIQSGFDAAMPDTVEALFSAQIDRLALTDRRLLRVASVLGMQVPVEVFEEISGGAHIDLQPLLGDFLTRDEGGETFRFRHTMLRDAAYEGLSYARRRELHALAGQALERRADGDCDEVAGLLAVHFAQAGDDRAAWRYARLAGQRARSLHASVEAATFFNRALQAGRAVGDVPVGDLLSVAEALGDARTHLGEFAGAEQSYRYARRWATEPLDRSRLQYKAAQATERSGNYRRTLQLLTRAEHSLDDGVSPLVLRQRAEIRAQYGLVRHRQGRGHDAVRLLQEAVILASEADAADVLANALLYLDIAELTAGMSGDGSHARRALEIQDEIGDNPWLEARALNQLGIRAYFAGRWSEAVDFYSRSRAACQRAGDRWTAAVESANIAEVLADQGYLADAEPVLEDALETYRAAGTQTFVADGTRLLGRLAARRGDSELSRQLLAVARGIYESDGEVLQVNLTDAILAESLLAVGQPEAAAELARRVLGNASSLPGRHLVLPLAQRVLGVALRAVGMNPAEARRALDESIDLARRHDTRYELAMSLQAVSDLWPADVTDTELMERDTLFCQLGVLDRARRIAALSVTRSSDPRSC